MATEASEAAVAAAAVVPLLLLLLARTLPAESGVRADIAAVVVPGCPWAACAAAVAAAAVAAGGVVAAAAAAAAAVRCRTSPATRQTSFPLPATAAAGRVDIPGIFG